MNFILLTQNSTPIIGQVAWLLGKIMNGIFYVIDFIGIPNVGLAIILFTIVVNLLMMPLTIKQQKFSKLSAKMNPEIQAIQAKYKDKKDNDSMMAQNQEIQAVYAKYGVYLPHSSRAQPGCGRRISAGEAQPGDLFFYGSGGSINHVAIYIGGGQVVHASNHRDGIKISNAYYRTPICVVSYL